MTQYNEASQPGSSFPNRGSLPSDHGRIIPPITLAGVLPRFGGQSKLYGAGSFTAPPRASDGDTPYNAELIRPAHALGPSVVGTVASATPVATIASVLRDIPGSAGRPLVPVGLRERVADALPSGIRQRATVWVRNVARRRSNRPGVGNRVNRE